MIARLFLVGDSEGWTIVLPEGKTPMDFSMSLDALEWVQVEFQDGSHGLIRTSAIVVVAVEG